MDWTEIVKIIITSVTSIIVALISGGIVKNLLDRRKTKDSRKKLIKHLETAEIIHFALRELRRLYSCDRIYIVQYHNGGNFYTESSMQRSSMTYERCSDGITRMSERYQNILVSHFTWYIRQMMDGKMFYSDVNKIEDLATRAFLTSHATFSHVACPIFDRDKHLIGFIGLDWVFSDLPTDVVDEEGKFKEEFIKDITREALSLSSQL